jgi:hypothetical protein
MLVTTRILCARNGQSERPTQRFRNAASATLTSAANSLAICTEEMLRDGHVLPEWWLILSQGLSVLRAGCIPQRVSRMNTLSGIFVAGFGVRALLNATG